MMCMHSLSLSIYIYIYTCVYIYIYIYTPSAHPFRAAGVRSFPTGPLNLGARGVL